MKEAIGTVAIFNIVIIFVGIIIAFLIGSLSYSKAFKVKNRIVDIIERYDSGYSTNKNTITSEIDAVLAQVGYRVNKNMTNNCPVKDGAVAVNPNSNYRYCIYEYQAARGKYYGVTAYMYFDIPIISSLLELPIYGETKVFYYVF